MAKTIRVKKTQEGHLIPMRVHDAALLADMTVNVEMKAVLTMPRSVPHSSKYWAILGKIVDNQNYFPSSKVLHKGIKAKLGYNTTYQFKDGFEFTSDESIAFDSMTQDEFNLYYEQAMQFIMEHILPFLPEELEREIASF